MIRARRLLAGFIFVLAIFGPGKAFAVQPDEVLKDPALESEARQISADLRCLVCQNQSIDDSDSPLARDLRLLVRERLKAGDNPEQVIDYVVERYGEFVLLKPRFTTKTYLLWLAPLLLFGIGLYLAYRLFGRTRENNALSPAPLSEEENRKLKDLLN
ncbi:MAG: cytochrome c-type biogenesis protein CcmH [Rhodomicrobium sp.]|nr:cytochrome c-type biogenesis protein CcmH [Rhodomicrobium sp.]